jgi:hypothetical protein
MKDFIESLESAVERRFDSMTRDVPPGHYRCGCGRVTPNCEMNFLSSNPYCEPCCGDCLDEFKRQARADNVQPDLIQKLEAAEAELADWQTMCSVEFEENCKIRRSLDQRIEAFIGMAERMVEEQARAEAAEAWQRAVAKELGWCEEVDGAIPDAEFMAGVARVHGESHMRLEGAEAEVERALRQRGDAIDAKFVAEAEVSSLVKKCAAETHKWIEADEARVEAEAEVEHQRKRAEDWKSRAIERDEWREKALGILEGMWLAADDGLRAMRDAAIAILKGEEQP